jgi:alpha-tubulin suppressor-like RCC1 family protein
MNTIWTLLRIGCTSGRATTPPGLLRTHWGRRGKLVACPGSSAKTPAMAGAHGIDILGLVGAGALAAGISSCSSGSLQATVSDASADGPSAATSDAGPVGSGSSDAGVLPDGQSRSDAGSDAAGACEAPSCCPPGTRVCGTSCCAVGADPRIAAGASAACAVTAAGGLKCWGEYNWVGVSSRAPVDVAGLTSGVAGVAFFDEDVCVLTAGGGVECWGNNQVGELGNGTIGSATTSPSPVQGLGAGVGAVAIAGHHGCSVTLTGAAQCWGYNVYGELGNGTRNNAPSPTSVIGLGSGVAAVVTGGAEFSCALTSAGGVQCWGGDVSGVVGNGSRGGDNLSPVAVPEISGAVAISAGESHVCVVTANGGVRCWGDNTSGQLGADPTATRWSSTPLAVPGLSSGVVAVSAGEYHSCALTSAGTVTCWGANTFGQLGNGSTSASPVPTPVAVQGLTGVVGIAAGFGFTCARTSGGGAKCWGTNASGELGNGSSESDSSPSPTPVDVQGF